MKHCIFLKDGELRLIQGEVPKKPKNLCHDGGFSACPMPEGDLCGCQKDINEYHAALSKLKSEAIRIGNKDEVMAMRNMCECGDWVRSEDLPVEGKLYEIEAEVEYLESLPPIAILRPVKQETSEDNSVWDEFFNLRFEQMQRGLDYEQSVKEYKEKFNLTRK